MIQYIENSADECGIKSLITNSDEKIEVQLNNLTKVENLPIMLIAWDVDVNLQFNEHGVLNNPSIPITALLMRKCETLEKKDLEATAWEMAEIFNKFIQHLYTQLAPLQRNQEPAITNATYKILPNYGMGKHSGIMCKWTMRVPVEIDC